MTEASCFICRKHQGLEAVPGGAIIDNALVFSGHCWSVDDQAAPYLGGFIVEPKRHVLSWADLTDAEAQAIGTSIRDVGAALRKAITVEHVYIFVLGHHIPHLHVWVLPRYPETPREFWGFRLFEWPGKPEGSRAQVESMCKKVHSVLI